MRERLVLAYAGGPTATAAIPWLADRHGVDVVAVTVGIGQGKALEGIQARALSAGALRCHVLDLEDTFAREFVWPALRAGADLSLPPLAVAAPLVARSMVEVARMEHAIGVAHGALGPGARQLDAALAALDGARRVYPAHAVEAPGDSRIDADRSLWGRSLRGSAFSEGWVDAPEVVTETRVAERCPDAPAVVDLTFDKGWPVAVNAVAMPLGELFVSVGTIASAHGVGRAADTTRDDHGTARRELREAPALAVLRQAHRALAQLADPPGAEPVRRHLGDQYTDLIASGQWYSPLRQTLDACVEAGQATVSGTVRLSLFKGHSRIAGRRLERYDPQTLTAAAPAAR